MFLAFVVWLVMSVFPVLKGLAIFATVACVITTLGCTMLGVCEDNFTPIKVWGKKLYWVLPLIVVLYMVPTERTSWYMVGAYTTQTIAQSDNGKELAGDGMDVLKSLMKKAKEKIDAYDVEDLKKEVSK